MIYSGTTVFEEPVCINLFNDVLDYRYFGSMKHV